MIRTGKLDARGKSLGIVVSRFNDSVSKKLLDGAVGALLRMGASDADITVVWVPGALEIPMVAARLAQSGRYTAIVCLGAVIRGETAHFELVSTQCAAGVAAVARETGVPVAFGVLTTENVEQALDRAGGKHGNKGAEAAEAAVETADLLHQLEQAGAEPQR
jgi:6,7-dimethyl-8-ribityllumazine synthase